MREAIQVPKRYEMKYRIPPELVEPIRRVAAAACAPDKAAAAGRYTISSLYLDSPRRGFYRESRIRQARRYKLRVRRYQRGPLFLEIKRKELDIISKSRVAIPAEAWPAILHDPRLIRDLDLSPKGRRDAHDFINHCLINDARPAALVRYERDAWVSRLEEYGRVTFDHRLSVAPPKGWSVLIGDDEADWRPFDHASRYALRRSGVVLELKCTTTQVPQWFKDLVHRFSLSRSGFSKYCGGLEVIEGALGAWGARAAYAGGWS